MKDFSKLEKKIGIKFNNIDLLRQALVHRSYLNENPKFILDNNERLEFLGDAVLEIVVTEYLYKNYNNPEGELTNWRASLVNSKMLAKTAGKIKLEEFLFLSRGESKDNNIKARQYILADSFEALIGSIYLDSGLEVAKKFIVKKILINLPNILKNKLYLDPKSRFQELAQDRKGITPSYKVLSTKGPDHNKKFEVGLYLEKELICSGIGTSKQEAQVQAAEKALELEEWQE
ncbi:ribonuclease III [Patescibacteria group bacterium]